MGFQTMCWKAEHELHRRFNLTVRMQNRRMTRLTNAHSKSYDHYAAMMSLLVAFSNFCRKHETLKGKTPAMVAGLARSV